MFRFGNPEYLWLFIAMPILLAIYILLNIKKRKDVQKMGVLSMLKAMMPELSLKRSYLKFWLIFATLCVGIILIARPQLGTQAEVVEREGIELVIAFDVSNSMMARDVSPNRLARAKQLLSRLIETRHNDRVALIVFAGEAYVQMPLTADTQSARIFLSHINTDMVPIQGTAIGQAIHLGINSFSGDRNIGRAIVIITDGEDHEGGAIEAAQAAAGEGIMVSVIGIGTPEGAPVPVSEHSNNFMTDTEGNVVVSRLNEQMGIDIAQAGQGFYILADNTQAALRVLEAQLDELETATIAGVTYSEHNEKFPVLAWIILILLFVEILIFDKKNRLFRNIRLFK
jgi:Ca-activated chloride channel family protein